MKYNAKYNRWVTKGGLVYRYDKKKDKLVLCKLTLNNGYVQVKVSKPIRASLLVHKLVYETFVGEIPQGYEIDHINTIRDDNRLENLRLVTHLENMNNPITKQKFIGVIRSEETKRKMSEASKGRIRSEFGTKFKEHYGITFIDNQKLYNKEHCWYLYHNKTCRWEKE